jgi:hypothetical protein
MRLKQEHVERLVDQNARARPERNRGCGPHERGGLDAAEHNPAVGRHARMPSGECPHALASRQLLETLRRRGMPEEERAFAVVNRDRDGSRIEPGPEVARGEPIRLGHYGNGVSCATVRRWGGGPRRRCGLAAHTEQSQTDQNGSNAYAGHPGE